LIAGFPTLRSLRQLTAHLLPLYQIRLSFGYLAVAYFRLNLSNSQPSLAFNFLDLVQVIQSCWFVSCGPYQLAARPLTYRSPLWLFRVLSDSVQLPQGSLPPSVSPDQSLAPSPEGLGAGLFRAAAPGLAGVTRLHRRCCDETERFDVARGLRPSRRSTPSPLTLLPAARSPSRPHCCRPLVGSYPTVSALIPPLYSGMALRQARDGYAFCCGCSRPARLAARRTPSLAFS
jgi:hypothetical protein